MYRPKVSMIIPCYNCEKTLQRTLDSAFAQSYPNIEIIVVDDGSEDNTWNVIQGNQDSRIKAFKQDNKGVGAARNAALSRATGEWICFLDADDCIADTFVEQLVTAAVCQKCEVAYAFFSPYKNVVNAEYPVKRAEPISFRNQHEMMMVLLYEKYHLGFWSYLYKKEILDRFDIRFTEGLKTGEDLEFLWKYMVFCKKGAEINKFLYWYFQNKQSATHRTDWSRTNSYAILDSVKSFMALHGCNFQKEFYENMSARFLWSYAKNFSISGKRNLFNRLSREYDIEKGMRFLTHHCNDKLVKISAQIYLLSDGLFYHMIHFYGKIR